jgi:hypothetical protein
VSHNRRVARGTTLVRVYGGPIMRTTVGPLPSSVYWRRRAVVLGAVLLGIIVLFVSCSQSGGGDKKSPQGRAASSSSSLPTPAPADSDDPDDQPSFVDNPPAGGGPSLPDPAQVQSQQASSGVSAPASGAPATGGAQTGSNTNVTLPGDGTCADSELLIAPTSSATTIKRSAPTVNLTFTIKNIGSRTCSRDVGSDPQELYLSSGAQVYWSSDKCGTGGGHDVKQFAPGSVRSYNFIWNGRESSSCAGGAAAGPVPPPGQFQLRARLGSLVSNPVTLTFVD